MGDVIFDAIPLAVVVFAVSISMAKILAKKHNYEIDANQVLRFIFIKFISLLVTLVNIVPSTIVCYISEVHVISDQHTHYWYMSHKFKRPCQCINQC